MKIPFCQNIRNKLIVNTGRFISDLSNRLPFVGFPLLIVWRLLDNFKFAIEKNTLQLKARLMPGDNQLKKELIIFSESCKEGKIYQPIANRNFQDVPFQRGGELRFKIIKENLSIREGTLLDIGAYLGYFCHKFEDEGFDCYALEDDRILCHLAEKLKKEAGKNFKVIPQSAFDYRGKEELVFDVILALSIFHNFLKRKDLYLNLIKLLKRLRAKELFLETYIPGQFKTVKYYKDYAPEQFVNFIIDNSHFSKAEFIGKSEEGRPLYKFTP